MVPCPRFAMTEANVSAPVKQLDADVIGAKTRRSYWTRRRYNAINSPINVPPTSNMECSGRPAEQEPFRAMYEGLREY